MNSLASASPKATTRTCSTRRSTALWSPFQHRVPAGQLGQDALVLLLRSTWSEICDPRFNITR
jgi:hypothetical protein